MKLLDSPSFQGRDLEKRWLAMSSHGGRAEARSFGLDESSLPRLHLLQVLPSLRRKRNIVTAVVEMLVTVSTQYQPGRSAPSAAS